MKPKDLKQLATLISQEHSIDNRTWDFIIRELSLSDLKLFKKYLELEISKKKIFVEVADKSTVSSKSLFQLFPDKTVEITENKSLGAGMTLVDGDNHYDLSIRSTIENVIEDLKN